MKAFLNPLYIVLVVSLLFASSCSDDDEIGAEGTTIPAPVFLIDDNISIFDSNIDLTLGITNSSDSQTTGIEIYRSGSSDKIADATINGETATFSSSSLGTLETGSINLDIVSTFSGGNFAKASFTETIDVTSVISLTSEVESVQNGDTSDGNVISYETTTAGTNIDDITVTWKNGEMGAETDISTGFASDKGSIDLKNLEYATYGFVPGDTLIYTFTVTSGTLSEAVESKTAILPQMFNDVINGVIGNVEGKEKLNLSTGVNEESDISMDLGGPPFFEAEDMVDISFVQLGITGADSFEEYDDLEQAKVDFDAGSSSTSVSATPDDIYVYKIVRDVDGTPVDHYGVILIGEVTFKFSSSGPPAVEIPISAKENKLFE
ncbi:hypothetical protein ABW636_15135 [Aquimarina sp. 2201CG1-2-11]|uniref:hypothetical protein n=1 Tax=Aquimarina discodermiae TaxID=3231043 RepID=UPI003461FAB2